MRDGAKLIRDVDDLLEDIKGLRTAAQPVANAATVPATPTSPPAPLDPSHQRVWDLLSEPRHQDEITRALGLSAGEISTLLLMMEMKKLIRRGAGNMYERR